MFQWKIEGNEIVLFGKGSKSQKTRTPMKGKESEKSKEKAIFSLFEFLEVSLIFELDDLFRMF